MHPARHLTPPIIEVMHPARLLIAPIILLIASARHLTPPIIEVMHSASLLIAPIILLMPPIIRLYHTDFTMLPIRFSIVFQFLIHQIKKPAISHN